MSFEVNRCNTASPVTQKEMNEAMLSPVCSAELLERVNNIGKTSLTQNAYKKVAAMPDLKDQVRAFVKMCSSKRTEKASSLRVNC